MHACRLNGFRCDTRIPLLLVVDIPTDKEWQWEKNGVPWFIG